MSIFSYNSLLAVSTGSNLSCGFVEQNTFTIVLLTPNRILQSPFLVILGRLYGVKKGGCSLGAPSPRSLPLSFEDAKIG